jgi:tRNA-splicing endonuclease subunit Sen34
LFISFWSGAAVFVDDPLAYKQPTIQQLQKWSAEQKHSMKTQLAYTETKAGKESSNPGRAMSDEALRKRKEREERKKAQAAAKAAAEGAVDFSITNPVEVEGANTPVETNTSTSEGPKNSSLPYSITIPASSSSLEWYDTTECTYSTIESAREAGVWDYPSTLSERARCGVFKDLWKQGYFMGGGIKFGGEYLVYPGEFQCRSTRNAAFTKKNNNQRIGDPLRYHSHFAASVLESPTASLRPMEIVAHGRLGTATKKAHLLCGWDDETQEVSYLSIEWAGFG